MSFLQMCGLLAFVALVFLAFGIWGRIPENEPPGPMGPKLFNNTTLGVTGVILLLIAAIATLSNLLSNAVG